MSFDPKPISPALGGTGQTTYTDGQLLIGNSTGNTLAKTTITAGSGVTVTNGSGTITIAASGGSSANLWDGFLDATDETWTTTSGSYADFGAGSSISLTENNNRGMGTVTAAASSLPGIVFTPAVGYYKIIAKGSYDNSGNNTQSVRLNVGGTIVDATAYDTIPSGSQRRGFFLEGFFNAASATATTIKIQGAGNGGTVKITNAAVNFTGGHSLYFQIMGPL